MLTFWLPSINRFQCRSTFSVNVGCKWCPGVYRVQSACLGLWLCGNKQNIVWNQFCVKQGSLILDKNIFDPVCKLYFLSDAPHFLKATRNNFENSHGNLSSRNLHVSYFFGFGFKMHNIMFQVFVLGYSQV